MVAKLLEYVHVSCNCIDHMCRGHEIYEVKQGSVMLVLGLVTACCKHYKVSVFSCRFHGWEL